MRDTSVKIIYKRKGNKIYFKEIRDGKTRVEWVLTANEYDNSWPLRQVLQSNTAEQLLDGIE